MIYCFIDCETTGLNPQRNALISVAFGFKEDLENKEFIDLVEFKMNPGDFEIHPKALKVNGYSIEEIKSWPDRWASTTEILTLLEEIVDNYGKIIPIGHNYKFDLDFLLQIFDGGIYEDLFHYRYWDTMVIEQFLMYCDGEKESLSLVEICKRYGIEHEAHTAVGDVKATAELLFKQIMENLK